MIQAIVAMESTSLNTNSLKINIMKKLTKIFTLVAIAGMIFSCAKDVAPVDNQLQSSPMLKGKKQGCTTIQSGTLLASNGSVLKVGFDEWGYNYQANMFNGFYCDSYRNAVWCLPYKDVALIMKWNNAWLSNTD